MTQLRVGLEGCCGKVNISHHGFPPPWDFFQDEEFELAAPRDPGELGVELMAQCRDNGRITDHFRLAVGGTKLLELYVSVKQLLPVDSLPDWSILISVWPHHIKLRRNMATSDWADLRACVEANDLLVYNEEKEPIDNKQLLDLISKLDKTVTGASYRWAVIVGEDKRLQLELQALPCAAAILTGKPLLNG